MTFALITLALMLQSIPDLTHQIIVAERHWDAFVREYFGCPSEGSTGVEYCHPERGTINMATMRKHCEAVKKLYKLQGECLK